MENIDGIENLARTLSDEPAGRAMDKELVSVASEAVLDLPTQQKTVFAFRIWNEMTYREIAETMELSEATVRSHMHHALRSLRQQLAPRMSND